MDFWIGVAVIAIGLIVSIALHEIGHLVPAKLSGVKVTDYFVGFGKTMWSTKRGETEYGIKMLPLGGFVRMVGMFPPSRTGDAAADGAAAPKRRGIRAWMDNAADDARTFSAQEVEPGSENRAFYAQSTPRKLAVMFGGPVMNLIIATVLFAIILTTFGQMAATNQLGGISDCVLPAGQTRECTSEDPAAPASEAGLQTGDEVISWAGAPVADWEDLTAAIAAGGANQVPVVVERDGQQVELSITPVLAERPVIGEDGQAVTDDDGQPVTAPAPFVGVGSQLELQRQPITAVPPMVWEVFTRTVNVVFTLPQRLVGITQSVFGDAERDPGVVGLIGVGRFAGEIASLDMADYGMKERAADMLALIAQLNMALFVFNMVPLLPLDGGHIAGALYEGAKRRLAQLFGRPDPGHVDTARLMPVTYVVVFFLIGMSLLLAVADIVNPITLT